MRSKTTLVCVLMMLIAMTSVFAAGFDFGFSYGGDVGRMKATSNINSESKEVTNWLTSYSSEVAFEGTWFAANGFGAGLGVGFVIPHAVWEYGKSYGADSTMYFFTARPYATARYRYTLSEKFSLEAGAGLYLKFGSETLQNVSYKAFETGFIADIAAGWNPNGRFVIKGGMKVATPFYSSIKAGEQKFTQYGIEFIPYIGFFTSMN